MKIERQSTNYQGSGTIQRRKFEVEDTAMLANLLSNMYSDPILAVIREYICNAIDSHKAAGKTDVPVTVICPSLLESTFVVKDYGIGMSDDQVMKLFSTYGSSSKRQTNSMIGGFGIGSKSGFAYTDNFTVESIYNNEKLTYIVSMCETNGPTIELLSRTHTTEINGFTVKFAVKKQDINTFRNKLVEFVKYIDDVALDVQGVDYREPEYLRIIEHKDWIVKFTENNQWHSTLKIKMGPVSYSCDISSGNLQFKSDVILECPIGTFPIAPDRESIILKPETKTIIIDYLKDVQETLTKEFLKEIDKEPTVWRALKLFEKTQQSRIFKNYSFNWKGRTANRNFTNKPLQIVNEYTHYTNSFILEKLSNLNIGCITAFIDMQGRTQSMSTICKNYKKKYPNTPSMFAVVLPDNKYQRLKLWVKLGKPEVPVLRYEDWRILEEDKVTKTKKEIKFKVYNSIKNKLKHDVDVNVKDNQRKAYIPIFNNQIKAKDSYICNANHSSELRMLMKITGITDEKIILVPKSLMKIVPNCWKNLQDHIDNTFVELSKLLITNIYQSLNSEIRFQNYVNNKWCKLFTEIDKKIISFREIETSYGIHFDDKIKDKQWIFPHSNYKNRLLELTRKLNNKFYQQYPLVSFSRYDKKPVEEYIQAMNEYRKKRNSDYRPEFTLKKSVNP